MPLFGLTPLQLQPQGDSCSRPHTLAAAAMPARTAHMSQQHPVAMAAVILAGGPAISPVATLTCGSQSAQVSWYPLCWVVHIIAGAMALQT